MDCDATPEITVGPTARVYVLPFWSVTPVTVVLLSFHPTTTTFRLPAVCTAVNGMPTVVCGACGSAALPCTYVIVTGAAAVVALAAFENGLSAPDVSTACT